MSELVYLVVITNFPDYAKVLCQNPPTRPTLPTIRLNPERNQDIKNILRVIALEITREFGKFAISGLENIGRYQNKSIYCVRLTGWPDYERGGQYHWVALPIQGRMEWSTQEILSKVEKFYKKHREAGKYLTI